MSSRKRGRLTPLNAGPTPQSPRVEDDDADLEDFIEATQRPVVGDSGPASSSAAPPPPAAAAGNAASTSTPTSRAHVASMLAPPSAPERPAPLAPLATPQVAAPVAPPASSLAPLPQLPAAGAAASTSTPTSNAGVMHQPQLPPAPASGAPRAAAPLHSPAVQELLLPAAGVQPSDAMLPPAPAAPAATAAAAAAGGPANAAPPARPIAVPPAPIMNELHLIVGTTAAGNDPNLARTLRAMLVSGKDGACYVCGWMAPLAEGAPSTTPVAIKATPSFVQGLMNQAGGWEDFAYSKLTISGLDYIGSPLAEPLMRRNFGATPLAIYKVLDEANPVVNFEPYGRLPSATLRVHGGLLNASNQLRMPPVDPTNRGAVSDTYKAAGAARTLAIVPLQLEERPSGTFLVSMLLGSNAASNVEVAGLRHVEWGVVEVALRTTNIPPLPAAVKDVLSADLPGSEVFLMHACLASRTNINNANLRTTLWPSSSLLARLHPGMLRDGILASARANMLEVANVQPPQPALDWATRAAADATLHGTAFFNAQLALLHTADPSAPAEIAMHPVLPLAVTAGNRTFAACIANPTLAAQLPIVATFLPQGLAQATPAAIGTLALAQGQLAPITAGHMTVAVIAGTAVITALTLAAA